MCSMLTGCSEDITTAQSSPDVPLAPLDSSCFEDEGDKVLKIDKRSKSIFKSVKLDRKKKSLSNLRSTEDEI